MKKTLFLLSSYFLFNAHLLAQKAQQGIYLSANDFRDNKISFAPVQGKRYKLTLNETFYKPTIKVSIGDSTHTLYKDSIFGYRDKENMIHRFFGKTIYDVLNPDETILLYSITSLGGYKNTQTIVKYFFSTTTNANVSALTKWNLKKAFPNDTVFHELLDLYFKSDDDLVAYDNFNKIYKLNRIFQFKTQFLKTSKAITNEQK